MKTLIVNVPMIEVHDGVLWSGPQNGSCWSHCVPGLYSYVPFCFHSAYAASFLRLNGEDATFFDGWAYRITDYSILKAYIADFNADIVVFEVSTPVANQTLAIAKWAKESLGCKIVLVGQHMSAYIDDVLQLPYVDAAVKNEFDLPLLKIARGSTQRKFEGEWVENVDEVNGKNWAPFIDYNVVQNYLDPSMVHEKVQLQINSARSCPWKCTYCAFPQTNYAKYRMRGADYILDEVKTVIDTLKSRGQFEVKSLFEDTETFGLGSKDRLKKIMAGFKSFGLPFSIMTRTDTWSLEDMEMFLDAGCASARFGVESFHQHLLDRVEKRLDAKVSLDNMMWLATHAKGFHMRLLTMKNLPGETPEEEAEDMRKFLLIQEAAAAHGNRCEIQQSACIPLPGTKLWKQLQAAGKGAQMQDFADYNALPDACSPLPAKLDTYADAVPLTISAKGSK
jgi:radical SAM superfamily enzyme YgiQ (UPF0313 family)